MIDKKQQRIESAYLRIWRKDAIHKLSEVGIKFQKEPKNKEIEKLLKDNNIDFPEAMFFCRSSLEATCVVENKYTEQKISRKIKSTLPCPTINKKVVKNTNRIRPVGYKQKSKKSENVNCDNFYDTWAWKDLRYQALSIYGRRCMSCGQSPSKENKVVLHVDHIKSIRKHPELSLSIDNLQILCGDCNQGKGYWDETDFREVSSFNVTEEKLSALHDFVQREYNEAIPPLVN